MMSTMIMINIKIMIMIMIVIMIMITVTIIVLIMVDCFSDYGTKTCAGYPGSIEYIEKDAEVHVQ